MGEVFEPATIESLLATYWLVLAGGVALFYYGRFHFNTPDYALPPQQNGGPQQLPRNAPIAKFRGLAPPMFTTSRARFNRYALRYVLVLEAAFLAITLVPELVAFAIKLHTGAEIRLSGTVQERAIWALFGLTGLLSSFPVFKDVDGWLLTMLHKWAIIPDGARLTASTLFDSPFMPDQDIKAEIMGSFRTRHIRLVAEGRETGLLEQKLINIRCLHKKMQKLLQSGAYTEFQQRLQTDLDEMEELMLRGREQAHEYLLKQDQLIEGEVTDIGTHIEDHQTEFAFSELATARKLLLFEVDALLFRMCLFTTVLIYATQSKPEAMSRILHQLGFRIGITKVPSWDWEALFRVVAATFAALLASSFAYPILVIAFADETPVTMRTYVLTTPMQVVFWAGVGAVLHAGGLLIALKMKRAFARARAERPESHPPENLIVALFTYVIGVVALLLLGLVQGATSAGPLFWALLPATTGYFTGKYVDKAMAGRPYSLRRALRQAGVMSGMATATALIYVPQNLNVLALPKVVWYFTAYSAAAAGLVGLVVGILFQMLYSHRDGTRPIELSPELSQPETRKLIGDLVMEMLPLQDSVASAVPDGTALCAPSKESDVVVGRSVMARATTEQVLPLQGQPG